MSMGVINILKENEARFGIEGQKAVNDALIKTGYMVGEQIIKDMSILIEKVYYINILLKMEV